SNINLAQVEQSICIVNDVAFGGDRFIEQSINIRHHSRNVWWLDQVLNLIGDYLKECPHRVKLVRACIGKNCLVHTRDITLQLTKSILGVVSSYDHIDGVIDQPDA